MALVSVRVSCNVCEVEFLTSGPPMGWGRRALRWPSCWLLLEPDATSEVAEPISSSQRSPRIDSFLICSIYFPPLLWS